MANHLQNETSPYLVAHAHNPVDWYPWGDIALNKALKENKPIFISIGYSSCHWCHVMEQESFENEKIASILNENFISIKIDKEERPDLDKYFQEIYALMHASGGGWPTSIFLTPNLKPIYSATYIPATPKYSMMAFDELLLIIAKKWQKDEALLRDKGEEILSFLNPQKKSIEATKITPDITQRFINQAKSLHDSIYGGFGKAPKFPQTSILSTLLDFYKLTNDKEVEQIVTHSLYKMTQGGIYDLVESGFCRYATDEAWLIPHFEKMTYDNALFIELFVKTFETADDIYFLKIASDTAEFMIQKMSHKGLFYSASDADSEGGEGEYFVYSYDEAIEAFVNGGLANATQVANNLGITKEGNFEGKNIINAADKAFKNYHEAISILREIRNQREYPFVDKKIITSWNCMMISALFALSKHEEKFLQHATDALEKLLGKLYRNNTLFHLTIGDNLPNIEAFFEDYAYLAKALLDGYKATYNQNYLDLTHIITNEAMKRFYKNHEWIYSSGDFSTKEKSYDTSYPSSMSVLLEVMFDLDTIGNYDYFDTIFKSLQRHSYELMRQPISSPLLANCASKLFYPPLLLKTSRANLEKYKKEILQLSYPYIITFADKEEYWQLCKKGSCFAKHKDFNQIKVELDKFLQQVKI